MRQRFALDAWGVEFEGMSLRLDGRVPRRAYLAPGKEPLELSVNGSYATVCIPRLRGWSVVVFEE